MTREAFRELVKNWTGHLRWRDRNQPAGCGNAGRRLPGTVDLRA